MRRPTSWCLIYANGLATGWAIPHVTAITTTRSTATLVHPHPYPDPTPSDGPCPDHDSPGTPKTMTPTQTDDDANDANLRNLANRPSAGPANEPAPSRTGFALAVTLGR